MTKHTKTESGGAAARWHHTRAKRSLLLILVAYVAVCLFIVTPLVGPRGFWVMFALAPVLLGFAWRRLTLPAVFWQAGDEPADPAPGELPCPKCASLQTDLVACFTQAGDEFDAMACFACDHRWSEDGHPLPALVPLEARPRRARRQHGAEARARYGRSLSSVRYFFFTPPRHQSPRVYPPQHVDAVVRARAQHAVDESGETSDEGGGEEGDT